AERAGQALARALLRPVEGRALRVGVDQGDAAPTDRQFAGEMQRKCRLAHAAFLVEQRDDHLLPPGGSRGSRGASDRVSSPSSLVGARCGAGSANGSFFFPATLRFRAVSRMRFSTSRARSSRLDSLLAGVLTS